MRPNVALVASSAPNVAFGASNAPNATLGRLRSRGQLGGVNGFSAGAGVPDGGVGGSG